MLEFNIKHGTSGAWRWKNFKAEELACRCGCGAVKIDEGLMDDLQIMRDSLQFPFIISSGYRCPTHNLEVSDTGATGPHTTGYAVDIVVAGQRAFSLVQSALKRGFRGIGIMQRGPREKRFIHLDKVPDDEKILRPALWSY